MQSEIIQRKTDLLYNVTKFSCLFLHPLVSRGLSPVNFTKAKSGIRVEVSVHNSYKFMTRALGQMETAGCGIANTRQLTLEDYVSPRLQPGNVFEILMQDMGGGADPSDIIS